MATSAPAKTPAGQRADPVYYERRRHGDYHQRGHSGLQQRSYEDALTLYQDAAAKPGGDQLRVLNGIYLASWKLRRTNEAEEAFGKVVAMGLSDNNLGVKFLFNPGTTNFWSDPQVSGPYGFWLRQIARQAVLAQGVHERSGPHQPHRIRAVQRPPFLAARRIHQAAPREGGTPARTAHQRRRGWASGRTSSARGPTTRVTRSIGGSSSRSPSARSGDTINASPERMEDVMNTVADRDPNPPGVLAEDRPGEVRARRAEDRQL